MEMNDDEFVTFTQEMKQNGVINVEFILEAGEARVSFSHQSWPTHAYKHHASDQFGPLGMSIQMKSTSKIAVWCMPGMPGMPDTRQLV